MTLSSPALRGTLLQFDLSLNFYLLMKLGQYLFEVGCQMKHRDEKVYDRWLVLEVELLLLSLFWIELNFEAFSFQYLVDLRQYLKICLALRRIAFGHLWLCSLQFRRWSFSVQAFYSLGHCINITTNSCVCTHRGLLQYSSPLIQLHESIHSPNWSFSQLETSSTFLGWHQSIANQPIVYSLLIKTPWSSS